MPEETFIFIPLVLMLSAAVGMIVYCLRLARKYRKIETDMRCIYQGTTHQVIEIVYFREDWFLRKARLHSDNYPYVVDVLISDVRAIS